MRWDDPQSAQLPKKKSRSVAESLSRRKSVSPLHFCTACARYCCLAGQFPLLTKLVRIDKRAVSCPCQIAGVEGERAKVVIPGPLSRSKPSRSRDRTSDPTSFEVLCFTMPFP